MIRRCLPLALSLGLVLASGVQCGREAGSKPVSGRPSRRFDAPSELIPADIDVVLRIAWSRVRAGPLQAAALGALPQSASGLPLGALLDRARVVFLGLRIMPDGLRGDGVVVIETDSTEMDESLLRSIFGSELHDRRSGVRSGRIFVRSGHLDRFAPALLWILEGEALVVATASEMDSVERTATLGADPNHLDPPARGLLSFCARMPAGADWAAELREPLRALLSDLRSASGAVDLDGDDLRLAADFVFGSPEAARAAETRAGRVLKELARRKDASAARQEGTSGPRARERDEDDDGVGRQESERRGTPGVGDRLQVQGRTLSVSVAVPLRLLATGG